MKITYKFQVGTFSYLFDNLKCWTKWQIRDKLQTVFNLKYSLGYLYFCTLTDLFVPYTYEYI